MAIGDKIKRIRKIRGLTLRELGKAIGFDEKTADVRMAQYESGTRTPKEDLLQSIAKALNVNYRYLYEPKLYNASAEDIMFAMFEMDEQYGGLSLHEVETDDGEKHLTVNFNYYLVDDFFKEWALRKNELKSGEISEDEYMAWKLNWPSTADDCGKFEAKIKWREE